MPEGDSVHRLAARLRRAADGCTVLEGELRSGDTAGSSLAGLRILGHETHGKHLLARFSGGSTLHTHLRTQGSWTAPAASSSGPCRTTCASAPPRRRLVALRHRPPRRRAPRHPRRVPRRRPPRPRPAPLGLGRRRGRPAPLPAPGPARRGSCRPLPPGAVVRENLPVSVSSS
ncbi:hypothetical protein C5C31_10780 [Rathayibacter rathayi]|uniref:DNA-formamidopyrimidine glycosylase family protein n=1 Tax=Rathayibacter rathayi TaxID=33887 RepID=UPI000CE7F501|nr:hypothetical protein C5C31_10780 [Rathayibacter rathayi]